MPDILINAFFFYIISSRKDNRATRLFMISLWGIRELIALFKKPFHSITFKKVRNHFQERYQTKAFITNK